MLKKKNVIYISIIVILFTFSSYLFISNRQMNIFLKTISFGIVTSLVVTILGALLAYFSIKHIKNITLLLIILFAYMIIPPYIHSFAWLNGFQIILNQNAISGFFISVVVQICYFLPWATILWIVYYKYIPSTLFDETKLNSNKLFFTIYKMSKQIFIFIFMLIFMLSINDFTIPSIFAYNTYPVEIMSTYSSGVSFINTFLISLPIIIMVICITYIIFSHFKNNEYNNIEQSKYNYYTKRNYIIYVFWILYIAIPIILMLIEASSINFKYVFEILKDNFLFSISSSIYASIITIVLSYYLAFYVYRKRKFTKIIWIIILLLFSIPSTVNGIIVNKLYQIIYEYLPWLDFTYFSSIQVVHVLINKSLPISFIIFYIGFIQLDEKVIDYYKLHSNNTNKILYVIFWYYMKTYLFINFIVVFILSIGELGGTIMVIPPGKSTLTITIYNYLHYGSSDIVSALCMFMVLFVFVVVLCSLLLYNYFDRKNKTL